MGLKYVKPSTLMHIWGKFLFALKCHIYAHFVANKCMYIHIYFNVVFPHAACCLILWHCLLLSFAVCFCIDFRLGLAQKYACLYTQRVIHNMYVFVCVCVRICVCNTRISIVCTHCDIFMRPNFVASNLRCV